METDEDLAVGEFGIATRMVQPRGRHAGADEPASQPAAGATQSLVNVGLGAEQPQRNLSHAEAAECLQCQHQLAFLGERLVAADEQHPQQGVAHLSGKEDLRSVLRAARVGCRALREDPSAASDTALTGTAVTAPLVDSIGIVRRNEKPSSRVGVSSTRTSK